MIEAKNISFSYPGIQVLKNISFKIQKGDFVAVLGPNGAGKTTLAKLILGLLSVQEGTLKIQGKGDEKCLFGYVPQKYSVNKQFPGTVRELLDSAGEKKWLPPKELGINFLSSKFIELSGGQQQRVLIALAIKNNPEILILDEPTVGVDTETQKDFLTFLKKINKNKQVTIFLITHDIDLVPKYATKILYINKDVCVTGKASQMDALLKKADIEYLAHPHH